MSDIVVDASVAVKWFVPEVHSDAARRLLQDGTDLLAPDLIWAEVGNVLWRKWRSGELAAEDACGILVSFRRMPLRMHAGESLYDVAWPVAYALGMTFYDSLYLALALKAGCTLVTADLRLCSAVRGSQWSNHCLWVEDVCQMGDL
ncbi:MAG: type II toxin-antitoxin system VapC family toxin [Anaerolineae bacterium]|nr:type II toxin-antitoxin system VapC family toxin [Anaerolineae bacterium]